VSPEGDVETELLKTKTLRAVVIATSGPDAACAESAGDRRGGEQAANVPVSAACQFLRMFLHRSRQTGTNLQGSGSQNPAFY
jgi:hypothetical protein